MAQPIPSGHNAFVYVYRQSAMVGGAEVPRNRMAILRNDADGVMLGAAPGNAEETRLLLIAGKPLRERIAQHGPFVMNTRAELVAALDDYNAGCLA